MAKALCVPYDDPVNGYPKAYARNDLPKIDRYPDGRAKTGPTFRGENRVRIKLAMSATIRFLTQGRPLGFYALDGVGGRNVNDRQ